jgi:hypothetical protein
MRPSTAKHVFFDLRGLSSFESRLVTSLAARMLPDRTRLSVDVLVPHAGTTMGFGVVGIAIGRAFETFTQVDRFRDVLKRRLAEYDVSDFSLDAVDALSNEA